MSSGLVICSVCRREVHQDGPTPAPTPPDRYPSTGWTHCEDGTPRCDGATSTYPTSRAEIVGRFCACDGPAPGDRFQ
jgi:hypothetical protein